MQGSVVKHDLKIFEIIKITFCYSTSRVRNLFKPVMTPGHRDKYFQSVFYDDTLHRGIL